MDPRRLGEQGSVLNRLDRAGLGLDSLQGFKRRQCRAGKQASRMRNTEAVRQGDRFFARACTQAKESHGLLFSVHAMLAGRE